MENNKRKTETELEQGESKKIRLSEREVDFREWIRGCELPNPELLLPFEDMIKDMTDTQTAFYENLPQVLEKDQALFANICPLPVVHEIAKYWIPPVDRPGYSSEQRFLFFALNFYIEKNDEKRRSLVLIRLMEIAKYYENEEWNEKYKLQNSLISVPCFAKTILAVMDHSNLSLIDPNTSHIRGYNPLITDIYGFDTLVQESLYPQRKIITDPTHFLSTDFARNNSVQRYNDLITERYEDPEFPDNYLKPLVLKINKRKSESDKFIYIVKNRHLDLM